MTSNIGVTAVGQIAIAVDDVGRSVEFYRDVFGLQLLFEAPPGLAFNRPTADRERLHSDCGQRIRPQPATGLSRAVYGLQKVS